VGLDIEAGTFTPNKDVHHTHEGSIGNLCNKEITALMESIYGGMEFDKATEAERALLNR
jgi:argininosuccinate lyase